MSYESVCLRDVDGSKERDYICTYDTCTYVCMHAVFLRIYECMVKWVGE